MSRGEEIFQGIMIENASKLKKVESPQIKKAHVYQTGWIIIE